MLLTMVPNRWPLVPLFSYALWTTLCSQDNHQVNIVITCSPLKCIHGIFSSIQCACNTASAGSDYTPQSGDFTFPANTVSGTRKCITINITDDSTDESEETIQIQLTSPSGATLGPHTSATVRITETQTVAPMTGDGDSGGADGDSDGEDGAGGGAFGESCSADR